MRRFALIAALFVTTAMATDVQAGVHVGLGLVDEIEGERSAMATLAWQTDATHPWEFMLGHIDARNGSGFRTPGASFVSVSKRFTWKHWFAQSGIAYADVDNEVLSKHFQFQTGVGYDFGRIALSLRHLSNANTGGRNRGETFLLLDYGF